MMMSRQVVSRLRFLGLLRTYTSPPHASTYSPTMVPWDVKWQPHHHSIFSSSIQTYRNLTSTSTGPKSMSLIKDDNEFSAALKSAQESSPSIFYFTAAWCGPCRLVSPVMDELNNKYPHVNTYKIDIDQEEIGRTLSELSISAVPTLHFFKDGKKAAEVVGADISQLKQTAAILYG